MANEARTIVNVLRKHERSGKLWGVVLILCVGGWLMGLHPDTDEPSEVEQQKIEQCAPLVLPEPRTDSEQRTWDLLTGQGWIADGDSLYGPSCEGTMP
jgi:hypothetical protein